MEEIFSKVVAMVLGCILMIILPMSIISERQKNMEQAYVYTETIEFVDSVCNKGIIYEELFVEYLNSICKLSNIYNVRLERSIAGDEGYVEYTKQITDYLESEHRYEMKKGDFIRVEVVDKDGNPVTFYGGKIKDEDY